MERDISRQESGTLDDSGIIPQKEKKMKSKTNSANSGAGFLIRNGRTKEEVYLMSVGKDKAKDRMEFGSDQEPILRKGRKWKCVESIEEIMPKSTTTAIWTRDETQAMYFGSRVEAQKLIDKWLVLRLANPTIVEG